MGPGRHLGPPLRVPVGTHLRCSTRVYTVHGPPLSLRLLHSGPSVDSVVLKRTVGSSHWVRLSLPPHGPPVTSGPHRGTKSPRVVHVDPPCQVEVRLQSSPVYDPSVSGEGGWNGPTPPVSGQKTNR